MTLVSQKATLLTDAQFLVAAVQLQHLLMQRTELRGARGQGGVQSGLGRGHVWTRSRVWAVLSTQSQLLHGLHEHVASGQDGPGVEALSALRTLTAFPRCLIPVRLDAEEAVRVSAGERRGVSQDLQTYRARKRLWSP